ncbi:MAG: GDP-mannose 4,6-dehydratase [Planctomycetaceae bacterium]|nr:GDP-mannose 4,6-dehydratase [Planctomycetota bacterium]NUO15279.1 GDP-mannose 4,6-dehydratase [Planctomycetaceae bacterium]HRJ79488.1 GDP-mannose 4,6-dehydratase [Planctomycetota bacterium]
MAKGKRTALITGITGQDGSYLAELLLAKGYVVYGVIRRSSTFNIDRIEHLYQDPHARDYRLRLVYGNLTDASRITQLLAEIRPDEIYNLGAQSHVKVSFEQPEYTGDVDAAGVTRLLESVRSLGLKSRIYQACSSEMFGNAPAPQSEDTAMLPRSPYAAAKAYAYWMCRTYREAYGLFIANGILFNHESPRRGPTFVTRKITRAVARIQAGLQDKLYLGNLDARRDWGYAPDYVEGMWRMLQHKRPDDFVLATGESHSVREFCELAFARVKLDWRRFVKLDKRYLRPAEVDHLCGDAAKARRVLGWKPRVTFRELVNLMVDADVEALRAGRDDFRSEERWFK